MSFSITFTSSPDFVFGFMCCIIRSKLDMKESENSAPFSSRAFLNVSGVLFFSDKCIINSAEKLNDTF